MKLARFRYKKKVYRGIVKDNFIYGTNTPLFRTKFLDKYEIATKGFLLQEVELLPPVLPHKVVCVGLNYRDHAKELDMILPDEPVIFLKPSTTVIGHKDHIVYPSSVQQLDYEAELAIVIGKRAKNVAVSAVEQYILGYTCLNDVTARDLQRRDKQWTRAKSFDTFCPIGPWIETDFDPSDGVINLFLNGQLKQSASTKEFIFSVKEVISFISQIMTLLPGDVIATGTPRGVGPMKRGDIVEVEIKGIGRLSNSVS